MLPGVRFPSISQYAASVRSPFGLFRTLGEPEYLHGRYGMAMCAGGNSVIFRVNCGGRELALKCYTEPHPRTGEVCAYMAGRAGSLVTPVRFLPEEIFVFDDGSDEGQWYDVVAMPWLNGSTLESEICASVRTEDTRRLERLASMFDRMVLELLDEPWAHGDLKPENVMLEGGRMRLVDYDAAFIPGMASPDPFECGTPKYRHPRRISETAGKWIDDYPAALVSVSLHALALCPRLYGLYNTTDNIIFDPEEIICGKSRAYTDVLDLFAKAGLGQLYSLAMMLESRFPALPGLRQSMKSVAESRDRDAGEDTGLFSFEEEGRWGYRTSDGGTVIPARYDWALEFSEGVAAVSLGGYNHYIDFSGHTVLAMSGYESIKSFSGTLAAVKRSGRWGYINHDGREVIEPAFLRASSVRDGRIRVWEQSGMVRETEVLEGIVSRLCQP